MTTNYRLAFQFGLAMLLSGIATLVVLFGCERFVDPQDVYPRHPRPYFPAAYWPAYLLFGLTAILMLMTIIVLVSAVIETLLRRIGQKAK